jgi:hypothetical protein
MTLTIFCINRRNLLVLFLILPVGLSLAQDAHYWTEKYGNRSALLNGAVIGSVNDLGAVYYNPARLTQMENQSFVLSAKAYEFYNVRIEDILDEGSDLKENTFGGAPSLVSGTFSLKFLPKHKFAYVFLTRYRNSFDFLTRTEEEGDVLSYFPGEELLTGKVSWNKELEEEWIGLSWAYPLNEKLSVGLTGFWASRRQDATFDLQLAALTTDNTVAALSRNRELSYQTNGILAKAGLAFDLDPVTLGLTITTPKWNISGNGSFLHNELLTGVDLDDDGISDDVFERSFQGDLPAKHLAPWSIGLGAGITLGKNVFYVSGEWFSGVNRYTIMEIEPFLGQSSGDLIESLLIEDLNSISNFGIGWEHFFSDRFSAHTSFATDFSPVKEEVNSFVDFSSEISNSVITPNLYHYGLGVTAKLKGIEFTLGGNYYSADLTIPRPVDFPDEGGDGPIFDSRVASTVRFNRWRILFGFSLALLDKMKEENTD